jgi:hypothetical protein
MVTQPSTPAGASAQPKSGVIWLASYPKSGNTWIRMFLSNLGAAMAGEHAGVELNAISRFSASADFLVHFADVLGFTPTARHRSEIAAARHTVQQRIADAYEGLIFAKTHNALLSDRGHPVINFAVTAGAVYIVRNPLDVAISLAHHMGESIDNAIEVMATDDFETPLNDDLVHEIWSSWSRHVASWTRKPHPAIHVMRYEDMLADPHAAFGALVRHLRLAPTPGQFASAVAGSSFDKLRAEEESEGFAERPQQAERFFREGRSGQWRDVLTPQQVERIASVHGEQMARFGYWPAA